MNCKYTYKGVQYNSYWGLREAILNEESQDYRKTTGLLASADTRQSDVREAIELVKLDFNLSQDDGELIVTDSTISGKYDIQHYIDSEYFEPEQKFYKKKKIRDERREANSNQRAAKAFESTRNGQPRRIIGNLPKIQIQCAG